MEKKETNNHIIAYKGFDKNMQCKWKPIKGYEGLYEVSSQGDIKSVSRTNRSGRSYGKRTIGGKFLHQITDKDGYKTVCLCKNGVKKQFRVHRLIAVAFLDNSEKLPIVNHKNENKADNRVSNLEWCSVYYNNHYGKGYCEQRFLNLRKTVKQLDLNNKIVRIFKSISEAANIMGINRNTIANRVRSHSTTPYYGYIWTQI